MAARVAGCRLEVRGKLGVLEHRGTSPNAALTRVPRSSGKFWDAGAPRNLPESARRCPPAGVAGGLGKIRRRRKCRGVAAPVSGGSAALGHLESSPKPRAPAPAQVTAGWPRRFREDPRRSGTSKAPQTSRRRAGAGHRGMAAAFREDPRRSGTSKARQTSRPPRRRRSRRSGRAGFGRIRGARAPRKLPKPRAPAPAQVTAGWPRRSGKGTRRSGTSKAPQTSRPRAGAGHRGMAAAFRERYAALGHLESSPNLAPRHQCKSPAEGSRGFQEGPTSGGVRVTVRRCGGPGPRGSA